MSPWYFFNHFSFRVTGGNTRPVMLYDVSDSYILVGSAAVSLVNSSIMFRNTCTWEVNAAMVVLIANQRAQLYCLAILINISHYLVQGDVSSGGKIHHRFQIELVAKIIQLHTVKVSSQQDFRIWMADVKVVQLIFYSVQILLVIIRRRVINTTDNHSLDLQVLEQEPQSRPSASAMFFQHFHMEKRKFNLSSIYSHFLFPGYLLLCSRLAVFFSTCDISTEIEEYAVGVEACMPGMVREQI